MKQILKWCWVFSLIPLSIAIVIIFQTVWNNPHLTPTELLIKAWDKYLLALLFLAMTFVLLELSSAKKK